MWKQVCNSTQCDSYNLVTFTKYALFFRHKCFVNIEVFHPMFTQRFLIIIPLHQNSLVFCHFIKKEYYRVSKKSYFICFCAEKKFLFKIKYNYYPFLTFTQVYFLQNFILTFIFFSLLRGVQSYFQMISCCFYVYFLRLWRTS